MREVLAAVEASRGPLVTGVAELVSGILQAGMRHLDVPAGLSQERAATLVLQALDEPSAVLAVLAAYPSPRAVCWRVVEQARKPVVLVPPGAKVRRPAISRVLLPLDGTPESAVAVADTISLLARAGVDLVVLHVFDAATVPRFWDQAAHAHQAWAEEFLARNAATAGARLELRSGSPGKHVVDVAGAEQADLIALGWSQRLDAGRSRTVRRSVLHAGVPVLLVPAGGG
jgi:nucleotide-binding universal stress UspA family protein